MPGVTLTDKQQRFVDEYLIDLNAAAAFLRAGYKAKNQHVAATGSSRLLAVPHVAAAIAAAQAARSVKVGVDAVRVLEELIVVGFSDMGDILDYTGDDVRMKRASEIPVRARRAIASVKAKRYVEGRGEDAKVVEVLEFKLWPKVPALEQIARHLGMFPKDSKLDVTSGGKPLESGRDLIDRILQSAANFAAAAEDASTLEGDAAGDPA